MTYNCIKPKNRVFLQSRKACEKRQVNSNDNKARNLRPQVDEDLLALRIVFRSFRTSLTFHLLPEPIAETVQV